MPRAGVLSPSHCQDMCLDLCMSFGALLAFTWGPEQMWHFLRIRAPALSSGVGLVDNTEGASRLPVLVLLLSRVGPGKAQRTGRGYVGEDEGAGHPPPSPPHPGEMQKHRVLPWPLSVQHPPPLLLPIHVTDHPQCAAWGCLGEPDQVLPQELQCSGGGCCFLSA